MARSGPITLALRRALRNAAVDARDEAGVFLARRYAQLLDDSAPAAKYARALETLRTATAGGDEDVRRAFLVVSTALAAHSVASDLGPKLKDLLGALGLTPAGRKSAKAAVDVPPPAVDTQPTPRGADELERLRRERAARQH